MHLQNSYQTTDFVVQFLLFFVPSLPNGAISDRLWKVERSDDNELE
jgi:hypothetical protein